MKGNYFVQNNIKYIIDVSQINLLPEYESISYYKYDVPDNANAPISDYFKEIHLIFEKAKEENVCAFIHCNQGVSRSASIVLAYLINYSGMTLKQAWDFTKSKRHIIFPNEGFMRQLALLENQVHNHNTVSFGKYGQIFWIYKNDN